MDKQRILHLYLNYAEWGVGVFGAQAAAQHYFGIPASQLNAYQAARLAAMLPRPRHYDKHRDSAFLASRTEFVLRWMPQMQLP
jgi:monofunctional biosynthetic peptidoglycan transglycosylase